MPAKKSHPKKSAKRSTKCRDTSAVQTGHLHSGGRTTLAQDNTPKVELPGANEERPPAPKRNGRARKEPAQLNPESAEERKLRLAARKALTLKAARIAYENHHRRKAS
jgi:hypothetical protein